MVNTRITRHICYCCGVISWYHCCHLVCKLCGFMVLNPSAALHIHCWMWLLIESWEAGRKSRAQPPQAQLKEYIPIFVCLYSGLFSADIPGYLNTWRNYRTIQMFRSLIARGLWSQSSHVIKKKHLRQAMIIACPIDSAIVDLLCMIIT